MSVGSVRRHLVLVGGGHAHLEVLRQFAERPLLNADVTLVSTFAFHHYSSLVPGYLQRRHEEREFTFDLRAICRAARVTFVTGSAEAIETAQQRVIVRGDATHNLHYDELSLDIGSLPAGEDTAGVRDHAATVRPMTNAIALRHRLDALIALALERSADVGGACAPRNLPVVVVGAGAGGIEVTLAIARRLHEAGLRGPITLVDRGDEPLMDYAPGVQRGIKALLRARGIELRLGRTVRAVESLAVTFDDGTRCDAFLTVWLTGAAASPLMRDAGLATDDSGFLLVNDTLRAEHDAHVWGAGDCVSLSAHPQLAKAGVYAVREGPILAHNLRAVVDGGPLHRYVPQQQYLAILDTGDGCGLLRWRRFSVHTWAALSLKHVIDHRFVRRYQRLGETARPLSFGIPDGVDPSAHEEAP